MTADCIIRFIYRVEKVCQIEGKVLKRVSKEINQFFLIRYEKMKHKIVCGMSKFGENVVKDIQMCDKICKSVAKEDNVG